MFLIYNEANKFADLAKEAEHETESKEHLGCSVNDQASN